MHPSFGGPEDGQDGPGGFGNSAATAIDVESAGTATGKPMWSPRTPFAAGPYAPDSKLDGRPHTTDEAMWSPRTPFAAGPYAPESRLDGRTHTTDKAMWSPRTPFAAGPYGPESRLDGRPHAAEANTLNVGIIGAGGIAQKLHLPQIAGMPGIRTTHLSGRKESRLRLLAERFDVPRWTTDHRDLLADDSLEGIIVALPHPQHVPVGLEVLASGKHLMMQKPLCGDMGEADAFVDAVENSDRTVLVLPHFAPEIYRTRELIAGGAIGKPSGAHCRTSHGGPEVYYAEVRDGFGEAGSDLWFFDARQASVGALFDMGVYAVASLVAALGSVESVMGMTATLDKPTELEDTASLLLRFSSGAVATAETGWCDPARTWQFRVHGTRGKITVPGHDGASMTRWEPGSYTREDIPPVPHAEDASAASRGNVHEHWLRCIRESRQPELSHAHAARHVTEILLAGLESSRTGASVDIRSRAEPL